jgi:ComF family protein
MLARALDVIFPQRCAGCGAGPWPFCDACRSSLKVLHPPWCRRCGRPKAVSVPRCRDCPPPEIDTARAPFRFQGPARQAIHRLKFSGWRGVGSALFLAMAEVEGLPRVEIVTWVPLAHRRLAERGFDQARVLATGVAGRTGTPCEGLLTRARSTGPQAKRDAVARRKAMRGAFAVRDRVEVPSSVLVVDDVLTTGATAAAAAQALRQAGARSVHLVVAARAYS